MGATEQMTGHRTTNVTRGQKKQGRAKFEVYVAPNHKTAKTF